MANAYCVKHSQLSVINPENVLSNNLIVSATASESAQSSFDPYDSSTDDEECVVPESVAETTPGQSDCSAGIFTATWFYLNSLPGGVNKRKRT